MKELFYSVSLNDEHPECRICVHCSDIIKQMKNSQLEKVNAARTYLSNILPSISDIAASEYVNRLLSEKIDTAICKPSHKSVADNMLLTTGNGFEGYKITKYHDIIFQEKIFGVGFKTSFKAISDSLNVFTGEEYLVLGERLAAVKLELKDAVKLQAAKIGANALLGIDFESSIVLNGAIMVSMTATAVTVEPIEMRQKDEGIY